MSFKMIYFIYKQNFKCFDKNLSMNKIFYFFNDNIAIKWIIVLNIIVTLFYVKVFLVKKKKKYFGKNRIELIIKFKIKMKLEF